MIVDETVISQIKHALETLRFGSLEIVVHDSKIVQIEKNEKVRFDKPIRADRTPGSSLKGEQ